MKTLFLVVLFFSLYQNCLCQEKKLVIVNLVSSKEITIKENKRIKVITKMGEKFAGRFIVLDQNSIVVDGVILDLNEIDIVRRHPLLHTIMMKVNFMHIGNLAFLVSLATGSLPFVLVGTAILAGGIYGAVKSPNISKGYKTVKNWTFKIKGLPEGKLAMGIIPIIQ